MIHLLKDVNYFISKNYPFLKVNKRREIERLLFEIAKRDGRKVLSYPREYKNYHRFKKELLSIRYPSSIKSYPLKNFYLPEIELDEKNSFVLNSNPLIPQEIVVEKEFKSHKIISNILKKNPNVMISYIESFKDYLKDYKEKHSIFNYNRRARRIYLIRERFDFLKRCPCTKNCISCNYNVLNLGYGCPLECEYCFLQGYQNFPWILLPLNINDFIDRMIEKYAVYTGRIRIGSGEFTDSLVYDDITEYSIEIINKIRNYKNIIFEFKTKTTNIENLFKVSPSENIVIAYSINPQKIIDVSEHYTSPLFERFKSLKNLREYGYEIAIHFDPIISIENWKNYYYELIDMLFSLFSPSQIRWISLGTFRFPPQTKKIIEDRFKENKILDEEMVIDFDGKLRYPYELRKEMYNYIINLLKEKKFDITRAYLCMEEYKMWRDLNLNVSFKW